MNKPYIKVSHVIVEVISYLFLLAAIIFAIVKVYTIKGEVPAHWDLKENGYGSLRMMLGLPLLMLFANAMTSVGIHLMPESMWNSPVKVKQGNKLRLYSAMVWIMVLMMLVIAVCTLVMTLGYFNYAVFMGACTAMMILICLVCTVGVSVVKKRNK